MKNIKLTAAQKKVIRHMLDGWTLHYNMGFRASAFLSKQNQSAITVSTSPVFALEDCGALTEISRDWKSINYVVSEAGTQAVKEAK